MLLLWHASRTCARAASRGLIVVNSAGEWRDAGRGLRRTHSHTRTNTHNTGTNAQHTLGGKRRTKVSGFLPIFCAFSVCFSAAGERKSFGGKRRGASQRQARCLASFCPGNIFVQFLHLLIWRASPSTGDPFLCGLSSCTNWHPGFVLVNRQGADREEELDQGARKSPGRHV